MGLRSKTKQETKGKHRDSLNSSIKVFIPKKEELFLNSLSTILVLKLKNGVMCSNFTLVNRDLPQLFLFTHVYR